MKKINKKAFTMIEIIIWVFIFSLGLVSVFALFWQSVKLNIKSKNIIIATWLAREQVELLKNIRNSNYKTYHKFNWIPNNDNNNKFDTQYFLTWGYYKIENNYSWYLPIKLEEKSISWDIKDNLDDFQLCLEKDKYIYCDGIAWEKKTDFYKYLYVEKAKYKDSSSSEKEVPESFKVESVVIWKKAWGWEVKIPFILADWKRL